MVRYADDFVILCRSRRGRCRSLGVVQGLDGSSRPDACTRPRPGSWTPGRMALTSWAIASRRASVGRGRRAWRSSRTPSGRRRSGRLGRSLAMVIADLNPTLRAGSSTSSTAESERSARWTAGSPCGCGASCANSRNYRGSPRYAVRIITLAECLLCRAWAVQPAGRPMPRPVNPLEGKTTDWRAGCGRSACPVRREGGRVTAPPYPYHVFADHGRERRGCRPASA